MKVVFYLRMTLKTKYTENNLFMRILLYCCL